jgi:hypothetical protein
MSPGVNFINILRARFFVRKFVQSPTLSREKTFIRKICVFNVDEIDHSILQVVFSPITFC